MVRIPSTKEGIWIGASVCSMEVRIRHARFGIQFRSRASTTMRGRMAPLEDFADENEKAL